jgi:DNA mismatch repair protein PMS2
LLNALPYFPSSINKNTHLRLIKLLFFFLLSYVRKNGFVLAEDLHASPGNHYILKAVPFSKNITFGVQGKYLFPICPKHTFPLLKNSKFELIFISFDLDVKELVSMLSDSQGECAIISTYKTDKTASVCPSRVRAMLASRACRMSTMIGDPLTKVEMKKVIIKIRLWCT